MVTPILAGKTRNGPSQRVKSAKRRPFAPKHRNAPSAPDGDAAETESFRCVAFHTETRTSYRGPTSGDLTNHEPNSRRHDRPRRKLPARYGALVTPLLISVLMSCIVSGISTLNGVGLIDGFIELWMHAWGTSWIVAFPILIIVLPIVRRIVGTVVEQPAR